MWAAIAATKAAAVSPPWTSTTLPVAARKALVTLNHLGPATDIAHVLAAGGPKAVQRHHERGKLLPRCAD